MIKALIAENFQSHKSTKLIFCEGINVIYGPSHSGKSSIVRVFKSVLQRSDFYLRTGHQKGSAQLVFDNCDLTREYESVNLRKCPACKEKIDSDTQQCKCGEVISAKMSTDKFILAETGQDAKPPFQSFGLTLPEEILTKTKIRTMKFVDIDENFNIANQFDDLFFVAKSYGGLVRNKIISSLIPDSDKVDSLIKKMSSELLSKNSELNYLDQQKTKIEVQLREVQPLLSKLSELESEIDTLERRKESLVEDISDIEKIKSTLALINKKVIVDTKMDQVKKFLNGMVSRYEEFETQKDNSEQLQQLLYDLSKFKKYEGIEIEKIEIDIPEKIKETRSGIWLLENLQSIIKEQTRTEEYHRKSLESLFSQIAEFRDKIEKLFDGNSICPISGMEYCQSCKEIILKV